jgi:hypothetical protein
MFSYLFTMCMITFPVFIVQDGISFDHLKLVVLSDNFYQEYLFPVLRQQIIVPFFIM